MPPAKAHSPANAKGRIRGSEEQMTPHGRDYGTTTGSADHRLGGLARAQPGDGEAGAGFRAAHWIAGKKPSTVASSLDGQNVGAVVHRDRHQTRRIWSMTWVALCASTVHMPPTGTSTTSTEPMSEIC